MIVRLVCVIWCDLFCFFVGVGGWDLDDGCCLKVMLEVL